MSLMLGIEIVSSIQIEDSHYIEILKQIKHYLTLQTNIIITDNQIILTIQSSRNLNIHYDKSQSTNKYLVSKNFNYLYTQYQQIHIQNQEDLQFLDICYECLMILKEYLPQKLKIKILIIEDWMKEKWQSQGKYAQKSQQRDFRQVSQEGRFSLKNFIQNMTKEKQEEFARRVNSNFKSLINKQSQTLTKQEIQNLLFLAQNYYYYKNKISAIRFLATSSYIQKQQYAFLSQSSLKFLTNLALDEDFRNYCYAILQKVQIAKQIVFNSDKYYTKQNSVIKKINQQNNQETQNFENIQLQNYNKKSNNIIRDQQLKKKKMKENVSHEFSSYNQLQSNIKEVQNTATNMKKDFLKSLDMYYKNQSAKRKENVNKNKDFSSSNSLKQINMKRGIKRQVLK